MEIPTSIMSRAAQCGQLRPSESFDLSSSMKNLGDPLFPGRVVIRCAARNETVTLFRLRGLK